MNDPWADIDREPAQTPRAWDDAPGDAADIEFEERLEFNRNVSDEIRRQRVRREAKRVLDAEDSRETPLPPLVPLRDFLARPLPAVTHRIEGLWPCGGRVLLAAQFKAGKSTLRDNLLRSLTDGVPFLDRFDVHDDAAITTLLDFELDDATMQRWLTDQGIATPERALVVPMKGRASTFNILDDVVRSRWAAHLAEAHAGRLLVDCLRPILDALGLDENREAGRFLEALDELCREADVNEVLLVHHMGHGPERSRGDSRLLDWPDALWKLTRLKTDDDPTLDDLAGPRFFSAFGRDVNVNEAEITFDPDTRRLTLDPTASNRKAATTARKATAARPDVLAAIQADPGIGSRQLREAVTGHGNPAIDAAVTQLIETGAVRVEKAGQKSCHFPNVPTVPNRAQDAPGHSGVNRARVPIGHGHTTGTPCAGEADPGTGTVIHQTLLPGNYGPCLGCGHQIHRYGPGGSPWCTDCSTREAS